MLRTEGMVRTSFGTSPSRLSQLAPTIAPSFGTRTASVSQIRQAAKAKEMRADDTNGTLGTDGTPVPLALSQLAARIRRLTPSIKDPEAFHEEKSEIEYALRLIAREVAQG